MLAVLFFITGCSKGIKGDGITVIDEPDKDKGNPVISVVKIEGHGPLEITDWLDENILVVSKENSSLEKLTLTELSGTFPRSLYLYDTDKDTFTLLKAQESGNLGGATLSSQGKSLLYYEFTLGDPTFHVMNMDTLSTFTISEAMSAFFAADDTVVGATYNGGAYMADSTGGISNIEELSAESLVIVEKIGNLVYYNTGSDEGLWRLDVRSKEKISLNMNNVYGLYPSPDGKQLAAVQSDGTETTLTLYDADGKNPKLLAEGAEIKAVSWSPDQRIIAYSLKSDVNGRTLNSLNVHDLLTGDSTQLAVDVDAHLTTWSPSGEKIAYTEYTGSEYKSSIVTLDFSLDK